MWMFSQLGPLLLAVLTPLAKKVSSDGRRVVLPCCRIPSQKFRRMRDETGVLSRLREGRMSDPTYSDTDHDCKVSSGNYLLA